MNTRFNLSRLQIALAAFAIILVASVVFYAVTTRNVANHVAQRQSRDAKITKLFGPDGRNVRKAGQTVDMMHKSVSDRMDQVTTQCNKKNVTDEERKVLLEETYSAGEAAIDKVEASYYQAPFEPRYPPLPQ